MVRMILVERKAWDDMCVSKVSRSPIPPFKPGQIRLIWTDFQNPNSARCQSVDYCREVRMGSGQAGLL